LDQALLEQGLAETRQKAQALILAGQVRVNGKVVDKAGAQVLNSAPIELIGLSSRFVGRGGDKLAPALEHFAIDPREVVAIDVGASTGGFTDCLLAGGASLVYAIDVGHNQLDYRLRQDSRVKVMEGVNARQLEEQQFPVPPALAVIDVSFISLRIVLPAVVSVLSRPFCIVALVKPQFELGRESVEKGGVVRGRAEQLEAVRLVSEFVQTRGLSVSRPFECTLKGRKKGNQEYFLKITSD
jgi:23S rRNA (cytidine1920-2'-O)/16S rRNA (cytidine1409-2'-O)-methyltransferase